jgi:hypothetical protein
MKVLNPLRYSFENNIFNPPTNQSSYFGVSIDIQRLVLMLVILSVIPAALLGFNLYKNLNKGKINNDNCK